VTAADHLGVPLAEVMAIGDAANDESMFRVAGTAVAMGQAPAALRELAHLVAPDVEADGVATVLDAIADW
jgi:5-amino-6-(5-phospho-D-ribitylamino)uracil phosphatase